MIDIDGSHGEGGGQIIRTALALSAVSGKPCRISNIRANRPNPGLHAQHLAVARSVAKLCSAEVDAKLGGTELSFVPGKIKSGHYGIDIGTAGSVSLVAQALIIPSIHAGVPVSFSIAGGTHVKWSPSADYLENVFAHYMEKIGIDIGLRTEKAGFYPKGGGLIQVEVNPSVPNAVRFMKRSGTPRYSIVSVASDSLEKARVAERQVARKSDNEIVRYVSSANPGSAVLAYADYGNCRLAGSSLGEKSRKAEDVGKEAVNDLEEQIKNSACLDEHMADQILPFLALAKGRSSVRVSRITDHVRTNIWVIEKFLPVKFSISGNVIEVST